MKRRLLIVEDDEIFLRPLQRSVEIAGYEVLVAGSGEDAIDVLKRTGSSWCGASRASTPTSPSSS